MIGFICKDSSVEFRVILLLTPFLWSSRSICCDSLWHWFHCTNLIRQHEITFIINHAEKNVNNNNNNTFFSQQDKLGRFLWIKEWKTIHSNKLFWIKINFAFLCWKLALPFDPATSIRLLICWKNSSVVAIWRQSTFFDELLLYLKI